MKKSKSVKRFEMEENMSLGENLQYLRKRDNVTQEQLAEQLEVSRQSVSKWESDTTYPEMEKLIQLCQLFHCTMDDLVQGTIKDIHIEDKAEYDTHMNQFSKFVSLSVGLIFLGICSMFFIYGCNQFIGKGEVIKEDFSSIIFFIFLTISVAILIIAGIQHSDFAKKHPVLDNFYTQKEIDTFTKKFSILIAAGVSFILIGIIIIMGLDAAYPQIDYYEYIESLESSFFMFFVMIGVTILVYAGIQKSKYNIDEYNKAHDKNSDVYKKSEKKGRTCGCIMLICSIIYLLFGFLKNGWGMPYIVIFAVGGILCAIASIIIDSKNIS